MAGAVALVGSSGCLGFDLAVFFLGSLGKLETGIMGVDFSASVESSPAFISMSAITSGMSE
jgi:hypothetical protein